MIVIFEVAVTTHGAVASLVRVNTTEPLAISLGPGVYSAPGILASLNAPSPSVFHKTEL